MKLELARFIDNNPDWEEKLSAPPYCIKITRKGSYVHFKYNQLQSDFTNPIVRECRGLILKEPLLCEVCVPFFKFGNYGESYADKIDWDTALVQEKVDGTLINLWFDDGEWHISTNGCIDAADATLGKDSEYQNYAELFYAALATTNIDFDKLRPKVTYMFEVVSPYNRVIIPYKRTQLYHLGSRSLVKNEEFDIDIGVRKPSMYSIFNLNDCILSAEKLGMSGEGYVVVDASWNRIKVKSPEYIKMAHLHNNGAINYPRMLEIIKDGEREEFCSYFEEYEVSFDKLTKKCEGFVRAMNRWKCKALTDFDLDTVPRKEFAEFAKGSPCPQFLFLWFDDHNYDVEEWLWSHSGKEIWELVRRYG